MWLKNGLPRCSFLILNDYRIEHYQVARLASISRSLFVEFHKARIGLNEDSGIGYQEV